MPDTPEALVGLKVDGPGLKDATGELTKQATLWDKIDTHVKGIGKVFDSFGGTLGRIAGVAGLGAMVQQMARLEESAMRTSLYLNTAGSGRSAFTGLEAAAARMQLHTGIPAAQSLAAAAQYAASTGTQGGFLGTVAPMGRFAQAYGLTIGQTAQIAAGTYQGAGGGASPGQILQLYANQAARFGMEQQAGVQAQTATGMMGMLGATNLFGGGKEATKQLFTSAFADALASHDKRFAGSQGGQLAQSALAGIQQGIQQAPFNPSSEAFMRMAGIGIRDQLQGFGGPHGARMLQRIVQYANRAYGRGSNTEGQVFEQMFGTTGGAALMDFAKDPSAKALHDFLVGQGVIRGDQTHMAQRDRRAQQTLENHFQKALGVGASVEAWASRHLGAAAGAYLGLRGGWKLGRWGLRSLLGRGAAEAAGEGAAVAGEGAAAAVAGMGALGFGLGDLALDSTGRFAKTGPLGILRRHKTDEELDLAHLGDLNRGIAAGYRRAHDKAGYLKAMIHDYRGDGSEVGFRVQQLLVRMLNSLPNADRQVKATERNTKALDALASLFHAQAVKPFAEHRNASFTGSALFGPQALNAVAAAAPGMVFASLMRSGAALAHQPGITPASFVTPSGGGGGGSSYLERLWIEAGGDPKAARMAAAVAMAESGGNPSEVGHNSNGTVDRGLWQINSIHGHLSTTDPRANARAAVILSKNGRDWSPWVTYKSGAYQQFLGGGGGGARHHSAPAPTPTLHPHIVRASFGDGGKIAPADWSRPVHFHVHIDGRKVESIRRLTRGAV